MAETYPDNVPGVYRSGSGSEAPPPSSDGTGNGPPPASGSDPGTGSDPSSGGADGSGGGPSVAIVDTDGDGDGLINVDSGAASGIGAIDGLTVDAITPDHLVDAHAPGLVGATVDDPGLLDGVGSGSDFLGGLTGGLAGGDGITVDALDGDNIAEVHAPGIADVTVNGTELAQLGDGFGLGSVTDGLGVGGLTDGLGVDGLTDGLNLGGITIEAVNGEYIAEAHAPGIADATVGGAQLGQILGGVGLDGGDLGGIGGDGITVDAFDGDSIAEAHVPDIADATVGSDLGDGSLLNLGGLG